MISVSLLDNNKHQQSSTSSILKLDMGSDSQLDESFGSESFSALDIEDEMHVNMLVQLENGMFLSQQHLQAATTTKPSATSNAPAPAHSQSTPEKAARKFLQQMGESFSCEFTFSAADLLDLSTHDEDDVNEE